MKTLRAAAGLLLFACLLPAGKAAAGTSVAFYPLESPAADTEIAAAATRSLEGAVGGSYRIIRPDAFEPLLKNEAALNPGFPAESAYPVLTKKLGVGYVLSGKVDRPDTEITYTVSVLDLRTSRSRRFVQKASDADRKQTSAALKKLGREIVRFMRDRDRMQLPSERESDIAKAILKKLPKKAARPPVAIAILENVENQPSLQTVAETNLHYYLDSCGFPVKDGENSLLRNYAGYYFANTPRDFPLTLTSEYYIIGIASAQPADDQAGLKGATAELEVRLLDRTGKVICGRKVKTEAAILSVEASEAKALRVALSEIAVQILPLLKY